MKSFRFRWAISFALFSAAVICTGFLHAQPSGMALFEQGYKAEDHNPEQAAELYRRAISSGLHPQVESAARWKLFYLYRRLGDVERALGLLTEMGSPHGIDDVYDDFRREVKYRYQISNENAVVFLAGVRFLGAHDSQSAVLKFRECAKSSKVNRVLRIQIVRLLSRAGENKAAGEFLEELDDDVPEVRILRAESLLARGELREAEKIALELADSRGELERDVKFRILYLLGRITRDNGDDAKSVIYFRQAANFAGGAAGDRYTALAAFSLYRAGLPRQAKAVLGYVGDGSDPSIRLLSLILRYEVDKDIYAFYELVRMRESLEREGKGKPGFLQKRGIEIGSRKEPG